MPFPEATPEPPSGTVPRDARQDAVPVAEARAIAAAAEGDTAPLAAVVAAQARAFDPSGLARHLAQLERLPASPVRDAALALTGAQVDGGVSAGRAAVGALAADAPAIAASVAVGMAGILADRGLWAEAAWFVAEAQDATRRLPPSETAEALWFGAMAVAALVEWNTYAGDAAFEELTAALAAPRARNLLRAHHAPALLALGRVLAGRGEFGAAAVSIARGIQLLPPEPSVLRAASYATLALVRYRQGDWRDARRAVRASEETAAGGDGRWLRAIAAAVATLDPALRGELRLARERIEAALHALSEQWSVMAHSILLNARIGVVIGANDWTEMVQLLEAAEEPGYRRMYTDAEWRTLWAIALRNSGRVERYRALLDEWAGVPEAETHAYHWAHRALLAQIDGDGAAALAAARRARECISERDDPLGRGWTRIVVGTIVSLYGDPAEGMESYEQARAEFAELDAGGFVRLCTSIIQGTAAELARVSGDALRALTAQQRRVAELVAEGYTSAEIGQILYLSKKTIDFHVGNIVSRLGLGSRREIKRLLDGTRAAAQGAGLDPRPLSERSEPKGPARG